MDELKDMLTAAKVGFKGYERGMHPPGTVMMVGREWAKANGVSVKQGITKACAAYWELFEERNGK